MTENPYAAPPPFAPSPAIDVKSGQLVDLAAVARYQKGVMLCILVYSCGIVGNAMLPLSPLSEEQQVALAIVFSLALFAALIAGVVCSILLAHKVYGALGAVLMGLVALIPCIGLLALLLINAKATQVLRQNGVHVGFFGADARTLPQNPFGPPS